jgi:hypothetical protein
MHGLKCEARCASRLVLIGHNPLESPIFPQPVHTIRSIPIRPLQSRFLYRRIRSHSLCPYENQIRRCLLPTPNLQSLCGWSDEFVQLKANR